MTKLDGLKSFVLTGGRVTPTTNLSFFISDSVDSEATFNIIKQAKILTSLVNSDDIYTQQAQ